MDVVDLTEDKDVVEVSGPADSTNLGPSMSELFGGTDEDDDGAGDDPVYSFSIAPTGRATCLRCGEKVEKGSPRCTVYLATAMFASQQHIQCTVFDKCIKSVDDLGESYRTLPPELRLLSKSVLQQVQREEGTECTD